MRNSATFFKLASTLMLFLLVTINAKAQNVNDYIFSQSAGTFTPITGGTVIESFPGDIDDKEYGPFTMPFTFTYHDSGFVRFYVNSNGFITLGSPAPAATYDFGSTVVNAIGPWGFDLYEMKYPIGYGPVSSLKYLISGAPGSHVTTIEFRGMSTYPSYFCYYADSYDFQIKLYEGSNKIEFIYNNMFTDYNYYPYGVNIQVGLTGQTTADYNLRSTPGNDPNSSVQWNATTAATANTQGKSFLDTNKPANGWTYTWTPPSLSAASVADFSVSTYDICMGNTVDFTDASTNTPTSWHWIFDGGTPATSDDQNPSGVTYSAGGDYDVTLIAGNGSGFDTIIIDSYIHVNPFPAQSSPSITISGENTYCSGGSVTLNTGSFSAYKWSTGATTQSINVSAGGAYSVTVTNSSGCKATDDTTVTLPSALSLSSVSVNETCGNANGNIDLNVTGGTTAYTFSWSNAAATEDLSNLPAGTYIVTVTDQHGCTSSESTDISNASSLSLSEIHTDATCNKANGSIDLTVTDGTAPFTYSWINGATAQDISHLPSNTYSVDVTDANGCTGSLEVTVNQLSGSCGVPTGVTAGNITSTAAKISWDAQSCAFRFRMRYRPTGDALWSSQTVGMGLNERWLKNLTPGTEYDVEVKTRCDSSSSVFTAWSSVQHFTTDYACDPPTGVSTSHIGAIRTTINWDAVPGAYSYEVRYRETGGLSWARRTAFAPALAKVLNGLTANTAYEYQVRTICKSGGKPASVWSALKTFNTALRLEDVSSSVSTNGFSIYPNPNKGNFTVELISNSLETGTIEVFNMLGQVVFSKTVNIADGRSTFNINIAEPVAGLYTVSLKTAEGKLIGKVSIAE